MSQADDYTVQLNANTRPYQQEMGGAVTATQGLTAALAAAGAQMQSLFRSADRKLTFVSAAGIASLTAAGVAAANLDQQMEQLQARTVMTGRATNDYGVTVTNLRRNLGLTSTDAITLVTSLNRLNVPFQQQQRTATEYVKLASVTGENVNALAQSQQQFIRTMGTSQNTVGRYSSMIAGLNQNYGAGAQATLDFANSIAPLSKTMGMSTQQISGISAAFSKAGADGGAAANVYTKILSDINRAVQYGSPSLEVYSDLLGKSVSEFKEMPKAQVITEIFDTLNQQGPTAIKTLERLGLEGVRSQRAIQSVVAQGGLQGGINEATKSWNNTAPFDKASQEAMNGFMDTMAKSSQNMQVFATGIGSTFLPAMNKMAEGLNIVVSPLGAFGSLMAQAPGWVKNLSALALVAGSLVPLLPKLLIGAGGLPAAAAAVGFGSLGQGFRLGRTPGRNLSAAQRTYMQGGGNPLYRGLFGAAMMAGDLTNAGGRRGRLDDLDFQTRGGRVRNVTSTRAWLRDRGIQGAMGLGLLPGDYDERQARRQQAVEERLAASRQERSLARRAGRNAALGAGGLLLESYRPLTPNYLLNSARSADQGMYLTGWGGAGQERGPRAAVRTFGQNIQERFLTGAARTRGAVMDVAGQLNPWQRWTREGAMEDMDSRRLGRSGLGGRVANAFESSRVGSTFTPEMFQASKQAMREYASETSDAAKRLRYDHVGMRQSMGESTKAFGQMSKSALLAAGNFGKAGIGVAGGTALQAGSMVGRGVGAVGRGLGNIASSIGPVGIAAALGMGAYSLFSSRSKSMGDINQAGAEEDKAAGSAYREALGEAAQSTKTFAQVMEEATGKISTAATSVESAIQVSTDDLSAARGRAITDESVKSGSRADVQAYAAQVLQTASPGVAQKLKEDVTARFGTGASGILEGAYATRYDATNAFRGIRTGNQSEWLNGIVRNDLTLSESNQRSAEQARASLAEQIARGQAEGGDVGAARAAQSGMAGYGRATFEASRGEEGGSAFQTGYLGRAVGRGRAEAVLGAYGIEKDDKASREGFQKALDQFSKASEKLGDNASPEAIDRAWAAALDQNLSGTTLGAMRAQQIAQGGRVDSPINTPMYNKGLEGLENFGSQNLVDRYRRSGVAGQLATDVSNVIGTGGGRSVASYVNQALGSEDNSALTRQGVQALAAGTLGAAGGDYNKALRSMQDLGNSAGAAEEKFRQLVQATEDLLTAERNFANQMAGRTTLNDRLGQASTDYQSAQRAYQADPTDPLNADRLDKAKAANKEAMTAANEYIQNLYQQYRALDHQREQGEAQLQRTRTRQLRDFALQQQYAEEDFARSRSQAYASFNRQRNRAEADFRTQQKRSVEDFNRSRLREEEDYNKQVLRMAEDQSKSIYSIYQRVSVQASWSATGLLQNLEDQNRRLAEQQENLAKVRKMGLSDDTITQLGLNEAQNAQQLSRLTGDLMEDPKLVTQLNKTVKNRVKETGKLMKDASNDEFTRMQEDRKTNLDRQNEDFDRSLERSRKDFTKSMKRMNTDFGIQMDQAQENFDIMRERQLKASNQSWTDMQDDFNYQMGLQEENINFFAEQTGKSFEEAYKTVSERTTGETAKQTKAMGELMTTLQGQVKTSIKAMDDEVRKPYDQWNITPGSKSNSNVTFTTPDGRKAQAGGAFDEGSAHHAQHAGMTAMGGSTYESDGSGGNSSGGGGGDKHTWPTASHSTKGGAFYGQQGGWRGSKSLGPGFHSGTDFPNPTGTNIYAAADGTVVYKGWGGAYGNFTKVSHGNGLQTWYAHQNSQSVKNGDQVRAGEKIGTVGQTGNATGPHLHFEVRVNGFDKDPMKWLKGASLSGGGGASAPKSPKFADMKSVKAFEKLIGKMNYLAKDRQFLHTRMGFKPGQLAKAMEKDFEAQYAAQYADPGGGAGTVDSGGKTGARGVWNALRTGGLTEKQAAGVMGNIQHESGFRWNVVQGGRTSSNPNVNNGYGLVQWTPGTKLADILKQGNKKNSLENQIWALLRQLSGKGPHAEGAAGRMLRAADTVLEATRAFMIGYERPANQSDSNVRARNRSSEEWYKKYKGASLPETDGGTSAYGSGMAGAKKAGKALGADSINEHRDPSGLPSYDMMVPFRSKTGDKIAAHLKKFRNSYGLDYEIWDKQIASPRENWKWRDYNRVAPGDWKHQYHVHSTYATGTPSARPGWALVGEHGYEFVKLKGGEEVLNHTQSKMASMAGKAGQTVTPGTTTNNYAYDHSVRVDSVQVVSNDPKALLKQMEAEARMAALTAPRSHG